MASQLIQEPVGIYPGMSYEKLHLIDGVSFSSLKNMRKTPAHFREAQLHPPEPTAALDFGNAYHLAVLEAERFAQEYVRGLEGVSRRSNADKARWAEFEAMHQGKDVLMPEEYDQILEMREYLFGHQTASELIRGEGWNEIAVVWQDEESGVTCKARVDRFVELYGFTFIIDLKSAVDASQWSFGRDVAKYAYHEQAAFYLDGVNTLSPRERRFLHVVQEKTRPYAVCVFELDDGAIAEGRRAYKKHLQKYAECKKANNWPAYAEGIWPLSLPKWAYQPEE